jgi:Magnesium chelatase, subunit ChlI
MADRAEAGGWSHQASDADYHNVNVRLQCGRASRHVDRHWLLLGPPGTPTLVRRLSPILPAMTLAEAVETRRIHNVAGRTGDRRALVTTRQCRAPHHTISDVGLIGGGRVLMPGDVALAHHSVLVSDERPGCRSPVLGVSRQPLEDGVMAEQPRGRAESTCVCRFSRATDGGEALGRNPVAASHKTGATTATLCPWVGPRQHE